MTSRSSLDLLLATASGALVVSAIVIGIHPFGPTRVGPFLVAARDPMRPLVVALLLGALCYVRSPALAARVGQLVGAAAGRTAWGVALLALGVLWAANAHGAFVAGGSDSYGYVSQADLWLEGSLHVPQPFAADAPWHDARWSFTPLGYRPAADGLSIVPTYSAGLPLLMAAAKRLFGQCALFQVVPIAAALLVIGTYLVASRLGRPLVGLAASALVAVSPTTLATAMMPMSDLPAAAAWSAAMAGALGRSRVSAFASGVSAAVAMLVRPNLAVLAVLCGAFLLWRDAASIRTRADAPLRTPWFASAAMLGPLGVAWINSRLYGSPLLSGYGKIDFAWQHVIGNLGTYPIWLAGVETPLVIAGLVSLFVPAAALWHSRRERRALILFGAWIVAMMAVYLPYTVFELWGYLRFFLPIWPLMMIGTTAALAALYRGEARWRQAAAVGLFVWLAAHDLEVGRRLGVYTTAENEHRYISAAKIVDEETPRDSVILTVQHSGSVRYYTGRMTLRWDLVDRDALDGAIDWLQAHGHRPYILAEKWEAAQLVEQYGASSAAARLDWTPLAVLGGPNVVALYDAVERRRSAAEPRQVPNDASGADSCRLPARSPVFTWR